MDPKSRLKKYVKYKQISNNQFTQRIGLANGYLTGFGQVSSENLAKINECYPELNLDWVVMGKGYMTKPKKEEPSYAYPVLQEENLIEKLNKYRGSSSELDMIIDLLENDINSNYNLSRSLIIALDSKDKIIDNLQKEIQSLRSQLSMDNK